MPSDDAGEGTEDADTETAPEDATKHHGVVPWIVAGIVILLVVLFLCYLFFIELRHRRRRRIFYEKRRKRKEQTDYIDI